MGPTGPTGAARAASLRVATGVGLFGHAVLKRGPVGGAEFVTISLFNSKAGLGVAHTPVCFLVFADLFSQAGL